MSTLANTRFWDLILHIDDGVRHYKKDDFENKNCDYEKCKSCGGKCCLRCGCFFSPDDFKDLSFESLKKEIDKGYITIELIDGETVYIGGFVYIVRARNVNGPIYEHRLYGRPQGSCVLLTNTGCKFDYTHRPAGGRLLVPGKLGDGADCHSKYDLEETAHEWMAYQSVLRDLADYYVAQESPR